MVTTDEDVDEFWSMLMQQISPARGSARRRALRLGPGQLRSILGRAATRAETESLESALQPCGTVAAAGTPPQPSSLDGVPDANLALDIDAVLDAILASHGDLSKAASALGVDSATLRSQLEETFGRTLASRLGHRGVLPPQPPRRDPQDDPH